VSRLSRSETWALVILGFCLMGATTFVTLVVHKMIAFRENVALECQRLRKEGLRVLPLIQAIHVYKTQHGEYPSALQSLVPDVLQSTDLQQWNQWQYVADCVDRRRVNFVLLLEARTLPRTSIKYSEAENTNTKEATTRGWWSLTNE
jgi:hypothetical protein